MRIASEENISGFYLSQICTIQMRADMEPGVVAGHWNTASVLSVNCPTWFPRRWLTALEMHTSLVSKVILVINVSSISRTTQFEITHCAFDGGLQASSAIYYISGAEPWSHSSSASMRGDRASMFGSFTIPESMSGESSENIFSSQDLRFSSVHRRSLW